MKSEKYWADRTAQQMWNYMQDAEKTADEVSRLYLSSSRYLQKAIDGIFTKYMTKHGLTEKEIHPGTPAKAPGGGADRRKKKISPGSRSSGISGKDPAA